MRLRASTSQSSVSRKPGCNCERCDYTAWGHEHACLSSAHTHASLSRCTSLIKPKFKDKIKHFQTATELVTKRSAFLRVPGCACPCHTPTTPPWSSSRSLGTFHTFSASIFVGGAHPELSRARLVRSSAAACSTSANASITVTGF